MRAVTSLLLLAAVCGVAQGQTPASSVEPYLWNANRPQSSLGEVNVFRRFSSERTDAMRAFYGDVMGFTARAPVQDGLLGTTKHAFTHGTTTINLWSFGANLPTDAQTGGMQYIVWNVVAIDAVVRERGAPIDRPLSQPGQMRTLWIKDPDGVSNYFAEFGGNDNSPPH